MATVIDRSRMVGRAGVPMLTVGEILARFGDFSFLAFFLLTSNGA